MRGRGATPLAAILIDEIRARGPITFAEYMEACLYHPQYGYYTKAHQCPRRDYVTSADARPIFGRLLARQFHEMWVLLGCPAPFSLVEAGAGTGDLAEQILDLAAGSLPGFYSALRYIAVERSDSRRATHRKSLDVHMGTGRATSSIDLPASIPCGCIFSNELLDALPVHRVVQEKGELREIFVTASENGLCEEVGALSSPHLGEYLLERGVALQERQQAEICLAACRWIEKAGEAIGRGFLLTIDYGHEAGELYNERHMRGTLLAYSNHSADEDYFRAPGEQDLTAHVDFTSLDICGNRVGLARTGFTSQTNFLLALARHSEFADIQQQGVSDAEQQRRRLVFKTLIYPEGMGETFQVFVQQKGIEGPRLTGFEPL